MQKFLESNKTLFIPFDFLKYFMTGSESISYNCRTWICRYFYFKFQLVFMFSICCEFCAEKWLLAMIWAANERGRGHLPWKMVLGCATVMTFFFAGQSLLPGLQISCQCAAHVPPIFNILKIFTFSALVLAKIAALKVQISRIFVPKTPNFLKKICSLDPTFVLETCALHTNQKMVRAPGQMSNKLEWM